MSKGQAVGGSKFRTAVLANFSLEEWERAQLDEVCEALDRLARMRAVLEAEGYTVTGGNGQTASHPLCGEIRLLETAIARNVRALGLHDARKQQPTKSERGRHAGIQAHRK